ncbi:MAG: hypothetical protein ACR2QE_08690 [Acidimicrobiales bacterium]
MGVILVVLAVVAVVVIALVAVGRAVGQLEDQDAPVVLRVEEAVEWIGDRLPEEASGRLSYDEVSLIVEWHLQWFAEQGMASAHGEELANTAPDHDRVAPLDDAHDFVVAGLVATDMDIEPVDAVVVVDLHTRFLQRIGAYGDDPPSA